MFLCPVTLSANNECTHALGENHEWKRKRILGSSFKTQLASFPQILFDLYINVTKQWVSSVHSDLLPVTKGCWVQRLSVFFSFWFDKKIKAQCRHPRTPPHRHTGTLWIVPQIQCSSMVSCVCDSTNTKCHFTTVNHWLNSTKTPCNGVCYDTKVKL